MNYKCSIVSIFSHVVMFAYVVFVEKIVVVYVMAVDIVEEG